MEKISLNKSIFKSKMMPKVLSSSLTKSMIGLRDKSKIFIPKAYPTIRAVTGEVAKGKADIASVFFAMQPTQAYIGKLTKGLTLPFPIAGATTIAYTLATRPKILKRIKDIKLRSLGLDPGVELKGGYKDLAKFSELKKISQPSQAQIDSGNYKKRHLSYNGMDISIENNSGSIRSGVSKSGKEWSSKMNHHYGYIKGTEGRDKDHVDVFINPGTNETEKVFIVNQTNGDNKFDEHKCMLGFSNKEEAKKAYLSNYEKGWNKFSSIAEMGIDDFKKWVFDGKKINEANDSEMVKKAYVFRDVCLNSFKKELEKKADYIDSANNYLNKIYRVGESFKSGLDLYGGKAKSIGSREDSGKLDIASNVAGATIRGAVLVPSMISSTISGMSGLISGKGISGKSKGLVKGLYRGSMDPFRSIFHGIKATKELSKAKKTGIISDKTIRSIRISAGFDPKDTTFPGINRNKKLNIGTINILRDNIKNRTINNMSRLGLSSAVSAGISYNEFKKGKDTLNKYKNDIPNI